MTTTDTGAAFTIDVSEGRFWDLTLNEDSVSLYIARAQPNQRTEIYVILRGDGTPTWAAAPFGNPVPRDAGPTSVSFLSSPPQPTSDTPVGVHLMTLDGENWFEPPTDQSGTSGQSLGLWLYGDGSDGPIKFTATPRTITDGVFTPGSTTFESATADFTDADIGLVIDDSGGAAALLQGPGVRIIGVADATHAEMSCVFWNNGTPVSGDTVVIGSSIFQPGMYSSITIPTGATAVPAQTQNDQGYLCSGEYYIDGQLDLSGSGLAGDPETGPGDDNGSVGTLGGQGGAGSTVTVGDTRGGISHNAAVTDQYRQPLFVLQNLTTLNSGLGDGAGGGGDGTNPGGQGGRAGHVWGIAAKSVVHGPNASYKLTGVDGAPGTEAGNCGGGGGGGAGWWVTMSDSITGSPAIVGAGGLGGAGSGTGTAGTDGDPGFGVHYTPSSVTVQT